MSKWYYELPAILLIILIAILVIYNLDFTPKIIIPVSQNQTSNDTFLVKKDSVYSKWMAGKIYFKSSCAACHNPKADGTGPALLGVSGRWEAAGTFKGKTGAQWLKLWIRNWHDPVSLGYPYAQAMANSRATEMNIYPQISDTEIETLLYYVENPDAFRNPSLSAMP